MSSYPCTAAFYRSKTVQAMKFPVWATQNRIAYTLYTLQNYPTPAGTCMVSTCTRTFKEGKMHDL